MKRIEKFLSFKNGYNFFAADKPVGQIFWRDCGSFHEICAYLISRFNRKSTTPEKSITRKL